MKFRTRIKEAIDRRTKYKWSKVNATLIVSTGRTGTEFLARFFNSNFSGVTARHEPPLDMFELGAGLLRGKFTRDQAVDYFYAQRYDLLKSVVEAKHDFYIESNLNLSLVLDIAEQVMPNLKIVHVVRDPRTCIKSYFNKSPDDSGKLYFMGDGDYRVRISPDDFPGDPWYGKTKSMDRFQKICWYWAKYNMLVREYCTRTKNETMFIRYEDLFTGPDKHRKLDELMRFIGLDSRLNLSSGELENALNARSNTSRHGELIGDYETWPDEIKVKFHEMLDEPMKLFGY
ncbi:MAG TPA: sulfotransferase domain-containing protein [Bacteroidia bacterium]|nr:sulfotransferase domain-containing protein [Bacteroidia bacterium]